MYTYTTIKDLARQIRSRGLKCQVTDLIALAAQNDPFYVGTETDIRNGRWFAELWDRFGYQGNIHLRRVHYQIVSQEEPVLMLDGTPYENTMRCWNFLEMASKTARYLEYVNPRAFVDRRNPDPMIFTDWTRPVPGIYVIGDLDYWDFDLPAWPRLPEYLPEGFTPQQRYHLEIWVEKSTMNDVLQPLCERYQVNLVTGVGEQSITSTIQLVQRAIHSNKPVRVFYVSDFDPAGRSMPVAVARKAEFYIQRYDPSIDFRLFPVALTQEQCEIYSLPRTPIKDTEKRKGHFEDQHGTGATELDALEALHPGVLQDILKEYIFQYYDEGLWGRVRSAKADLENALNEWREAILEHHQEQINALRDEYDTIRREFQDRITQHKENVTDLWQILRDYLEGVKPDIDDYPVPEAEEREEVAEGLFNSQRTYLEQLHVYKAFQGKSNGFGHISMTLLEE